MPHVRPEDVLSSVPAALGVEVSATGSDGGVDVDESSPCLRVLIPNRLRTRSLNRGLPSTLPSALSRRTAASLSSGVIRLIRLALILWARLDMGRRRVASSASSGGARSDVDGRSVLGFSSSACSSDSSGPRFVRLLECVSPQ